MTDLSEIAVGVPVLSRSEALAQFIDSVPAGVSRVVVADNGLPGAHTHVYSREWHVDIDVLQTHHHRQIDAEYRAGAGQHNPDPNWLRENWGIERVVPGSTSDWAQLYDRSVAEEAFDLFRRTTPARVWLRVRRMLKRAGLG